MIEKLKVAVINMDLRLLLFEWVLAREHGSWAFNVFFSPLKEREDEKGNTKETSLGRSFLSF